MIVKRRSFLLFLFVTLCLGFLITTMTDFAFAQELESYVQSLDNAKEGMTLWAMLKQGGVIMVVLATLSVVALTIIFYNFLTLQVKKTVPTEFTENIIQKLEGRKIGPAKALCEQQKNIISGIVLEGLDKRKRGAVFAREAMETYAKKEVGNLWQSISYLSDIAAVAPLIGLLGTVLGMIQAFNVIAFQTAVVKPILLAGGVSKAMVTTAAGLVVAIPVMLFYSYFRGRVQEITNRVEVYLADLTKLVEETGE